MSEYRVAIAYAKSVLTLAEEKKKLAQVYDDMQYARNVFAASRELKLAIKSPILTPVKKSEILKSIFSSSFSDMSNSFFTLIVKKGRASLLPVITQAFIDLYKEKKGVKKIHLTTAVKVDKKTQDEIVKLFPNPDKSDLEIDAEINTEILGGFIVSSGDRQIDASVKTRLQKLKHQFSQNPYIPKY